MKGPLMSTGHFLTARPSHRISNSRILATYPFSQLPVASAILSITVQPAQSRVSIL